MANKTTTKKQTKKIAPTTSKKTTAKKVTAATKKPKTTKRSSVVKKATAANGATKKKSKQTTAAVVDTSPRVSYPEHAFWVTDGVVVHSLWELATALDAMDAAVYAHHVTSEKHDFAEWVEQVFADLQCAAALRAATTPKRARTVVVTHLKRYHV